MSAVAAWILFVLPVLGISTAIISLKMQSATVASEDANVARQVEQKFRRINGLLNSVIEVHLATSGNQSALLSMAEQLRLDNPSVTAVGRYQNASLPERGAFQEKMAESGLYGYRIADLVDDERVPSPLRTNATPISLLEPMTPALLPLLGTDLAANEKVNDRLSSATVLHTSVVTIIPEHWPAAGQLMILKTCLQGRADSSGFAQ